MWGMGAPFSSKLKGSRFKVQGSRFKVQGSRFKVQGIFLIRACFVNWKLKKTLIFSAL
jgi:hypothetical protein